MPEKKYYYNYDIECHCYFRGGVIDTDLEDYAESYDDLCKLVRETFDSTYNFTLEDAEEYGPIEVAVNYSDDPEFKKRR